MARGLSPLSGLAEQRLDLADGRRPDADVVGAVDAVDPTGGSPRPQVLAGVREAVAVRYAYAERGDDGPGGVYAPDRDLAAHGVHRAPYELVAPVVRDLVHHARGGDGKRARDAAGEVHYVDYVAAVVRLE